MKIVFRRQVTNIWTYVSDIFQKVHVKQGWISDMGIDGPTFVPKFFTNLGEGLSQKVGFS